MFILKGVSHAHWQKIFIKRKNLISSQIYIISISAFAWSKILSVLVGLLSSKMNWVGGSRSRLILKNDTKKQREFFQKRKMQDKLKNMAAVTSSSSKGIPFGSMDLLTLFVVNQIAAKKELKDPPSVSVLSSKGRGKKRGIEPLVLPMSPCSPSQLSLVDSQPQYSIQGARAKQIIPQAFKTRQFSPVLETTYSDNSVSDYLMPTVDPLSPFSTSSSSSGQGRFYQQLQAQPHSQWPPSPWDTSGLDQNTFQPYCEPRPMTWSSGSYLATSPPSQLFKHARHEVTSLQPKQEPMMDFTLNQMRGEQPFEEDVFMGFTNEDLSVCDFGREQTKIYLKDEPGDRALTPQTVPEPQVIGVQPPSCSSMNFSCPDYPMNGHSPISSCRRGCRSPDSIDSEERHQPLDGGCCADTTPRRNQQQSWHCREMCTCKKTCREMREAQTQTSPEMCDAATQCEPTLGVRLSTDASPQQASSRGRTGCTDFPTAGKKSSTTNRRVQQHEVKGQQEPSCDAILEQASTTKRPPEEAETREEIADILLLLKQR
ncbi:uncharacterized protein LOC133661421 isoform X2 [Entelurus aequoreus]|uniref:uncharacterized protein LOC133661421 isoform X2 n=1 Tax=Entelurus aequoreus TaxID=161455 RepID=UPI002B1D3E75|nr:uncharacterized protein LOC133661421 isoform X2 [Entelurus aequoreus]